MKDQFTPLINAGVVETDNAKRAEIYAEFNKLYYENIPTILLYIVNGRHYEQRWVQGWYYNRAYGNPIYYEVSKK
jgi:ABC-type transport system substrate-binding protein